MRYRCPMHPEVVSPSPSACPICGMALVAGGATTAAEDLEATRLGRVERRVISEPVRAPAWVDASGVVAMLYRDDLIGLAAGDPAVFYPAVGSESGRKRPLSFNVQRTAALDEDRYTAVFTRFEFAAVDAPAAGTEGWLVVPARSRELLVVPASAVLEAPTGPYVLVRSAGGVERRRVQVGRSHQGAAAVLAGLSAGDEVVVTGAFLVDAELGRARAR